jgi:hypothetical protein
MPPEAILVQSGENETKRTQCLWPSQVYIGVSVYRSQIRTVVSPDPDARDLPSGEKATLSTASVCPSRVLLARVIGLILNIASGL